MTHRITHFLSASALALAAGGASADQQILDDLIVDGSACIGQDCVNGESFGFDTLRLKENNLRIKADDTSTTSSFPNQDWELTFNDSSNGGANRFSVTAVAPSAGTPFTIEASSQNHALYVNDNGHIGFGTNNPVVQLHIKDGNTPTVRLEQDGTSGFTSQIWDVAGNEAGFFVRDATNSSALPFRILPSVANNFLVIAGSEEVGIGAGTNPASILHINETDNLDSTSPHIFVNNSHSTVSQRLMLSLSNAGSSAMQIENRDTDVRWNIRNAGAGSSFLIDDPDSPSAEFTLTADGNLSIEGGLVTGTAGSCESGSPCDAVFDPAVYTVPSIEDHAAEMWQNQYLPAVGPTRAGEPVHMTTKMLAMLNELEHAHIYIEQLNAELDEVRTQYGEQISQLSERLEQIDAQ